KVRFFPRPQAKQAIFGLILAIPARSVVTRDHLQEPQGTKDSGPLVARKREGVWPFPLRQTHPDFDVGVDDASSASAPRPSASRSPIGKADRKAQDSAVPGRARTRKLISRRRIRRDAAARTTFYATSSRSPGLPIRRSDPWQTAV